MASNFRILVHRNSDSLHLKLAGDFDGSSACVLFNTLARNWNDCNKIFVHTKDLKDVHPFGLNAMAERNFLSLCLKPVEKMLELPPIDSWRL